mgnify:CR=1 FL=1
MHLDLKPENVVLCDREANDIKIIDFGLAQRLDGASDLKTLCGTPEFVSPEVCALFLLG